MKFKDCFDIFIWVLNELFRKVKLVLRIFLELFWLFDGRKMCREFELREEKNFFRIVFWLKEVEMINLEYVILFGLWYFFNFFEEVLIFKDMLGNFKGLNFIMLVSENFNWMVEDLLGFFVEELIRCWEFVYNDILLFLFLMKVLRRVDLKGFFFKNLFRDNLYVFVVL